MNLVDLWNSAREQIEDKQLRQIIGFAGDGLLRNGSSASVEFRDLLAAVPINLLSSFATECLEKSFTDSGFALQDIMNEIGRRFGFEVENGLYQGTRTDVGHDGLWLLPTPHHVILEVKTTDTYRIDIDKVAEYRRKLIAGGQVSEASSSILFVVGRDDTGDLEAQIRGSRHAWDVRLISVASLFRLLAVKGAVDDPTIVQRISEILIPKEFTRLDHIIDIVFSAAEDASEEEEEFEEIATPNSIVNDDRIPFTRSEKSVNFNQACAMNFAQSYDASLRRLSRTTFESPDKFLRIVSLVSKDYERLKDIPDPTVGTFWFGFRMYQKDFVEKSANGYVVLGCGSPEQILSVNCESLKQWLPELNTSTKQSTGTVHWHLHVHRQNDRFFLERKRGLGRLDITEYKLGNTPIN
ncbi:MAG: hypothetical protein ABL984_02920 [Pyrinomonadaceae bacterium]